MTVVRGNISMEGRTKSKNLKISGGKWLVLIDTDVAVQQYFAPEIITDQGHSDSTTICTKQFMKENNLCSTESSSLSLYSKVAKIFATHDLHHKYNELARVDKPISSFLQTAEIRDSLSPPSLPCRHLNLPKTPGEYSPIRLYT